MPLGERINRLRNPEKATSLQIADGFRDKGINTVVEVACSVTSGVQKIWQDRADAGEMELITTTHEHNLIGITSGHYLGTGEVALAHAQNSGLPNMADGIISHASQKVNKISAIVVLNWRGDTEEEKSEAHIEIGGKTESLTRAIASGGAAKFFGTRSGRGILRSQAEAIDYAKGGGVAIFRLSPGGLQKEPLDCYSPVLEEEEDETFQKRLRAIKETKGSNRREVLSRAPISREEELQEIMLKHPDAAVFVANGYNARAAQAVVDRPGNYYLTGYMGGALANAWEYARKNPEIPTLVIDGEQNAQMSHMKDNLANDYPDNLYWYILNNGVGASVGVARSMKLAPWYYDLARVVRTIPDAEVGGHVFPYPRVRGVGTYFESDEADRLIKLLGGPLPAMTVLFRAWTVQQQQRIRFGHKLETQAIVREAIAQIEASVL